MPSTSAKRALLSGVAIAALLMATPIQVDLDLATGIKIKPAFAHAASGKGKDGDGSDDDNSGSGGGGDDDDDDDDNSGGGGGGGGDDDDEDDDEDNSGSGSGGDDDEDDDEDDDDENDDEDDDENDDEGTSSGGGSASDQAARSAGGNGGGEIRISKIEVSAAGIEIKYSDGSKEEIENGRYERKNSNNRTVEQRPATGADIARLRALSDAVSIDNVPTSGGGNGDSEIRKVEVQGDNIEVTYTTGWKEEIEFGRYELKDPFNRTVVERPATDEDRQRLLAIAG